MKQFKAECLDISSTQEFTFDPGLAVVVVTEDVLTIAEKMRKAVDDCEASLMSKSHLCNVLLLQDADEGDLATYSDGNGKAYIEFAEYAPQAGTSRMDVDRYGYIRVSMSIRDSSHHITIGIGYIKDLRELLTHVAAEAA